MRFFFVHKMAVVLQNVVCTVDAGCGLDLEAIATTGENVEYNPRKFAAVIMRLRSPKTTALIFGTPRPMRNLCRHFSIDAQ